MATAIVALKTVGIALAINYGTHIGSSVAYAKFCVPESIWDLGKTLVTTASPVCSFLLNTMQATQTNYAAIFTTTLATMATAVLKT